MAPRANWKGFLRLSLVTCPVALYPATSDTEKVSFNQINRKTGHRIKYAKVDADTGEEVANEDIMKGYKIDTDTYIEVSKDELDDIALESTRTIEIDEFVPKTDIDNRYLIRPYYLVPDGKVGHDAFAVIRETIRSMNKVAIGRVVLTNREHIIALEPLDKGLMGTLLRYPYEVRNEKEYFDDIQDVKITKDMLDLAKHIVEQKSASFEPEQFEDRYEQALIDLINQKRNGLGATAKAAPKSAGNVINLMDALKRSLAGDKQAAAGRQGSGSGEDEGQEAEEARRGPARDAAADQRRRQARRQGNGQRSPEEGREAGAQHRRPREEGRMITPAARDYRPRQPQSPLQSPSPPEIQSAEITAVASATLRPFPEHQVHQQGEDQHRGENAPRILPDIVDGSRTPGQQQRAEQQLLHDTVADLPLLQRGADVGELGVEGAANAIDDGHDHDAEAARDDGVFNRGRGGFIVEEFLD